jgi:hypothetical protein
VRGFRPDHRSGPTERPRGAPRWSTRRSRPG